jgi:hypothetical protein
MTIAIAVFCVLCALFLVALTLHDEILKESACKPSVDHRHIGPKPQR